MRLRRPCVGAATKIDIGTWKAHFDFFNLLAFVDRSAGWLDGTLLRRPDEADGAGVRRPGMVLATARRALVTAPWEGTIRYRGPLLAFGNVIILEPGAGYLLVLAGLDVVYGEVGEVVAAGAPLGLMGGGEPGMDEFLYSAQDGGAGRESETLYVELRQGGEAIDPLPWFAATAPLAGAEQVP